MKQMLYIAITIALMVFSCGRGQFHQEHEEGKVVEQAAVANPKIQGHRFLECMHQDAYFPKFLVDKCKNILLELCQNIEKTKPNNLRELYALTHVSTEQINDLQEAFSENDSEIETAARDCIAAEFEYISEAYGFDADVEELMATRDW